MNKINLYRQYTMEKIFWGGLVVYEIEDELITEERDIFDLLDKVCVIEKLNPLKGSWQKLRFEDFEKMLMGALTLDLAYTGAVRMSKKKARVIYKHMMDGIDLETSGFYTNWDRNPWASENGAGWNPLTANTFDMGIVVIDGKRLVLLHVISED